MRAMIQGQAGGRRATGGLQERVRRRRLRGNAVRNGTEIHFGMVGGHPLRLDSWTLRFAAMMRLMGHPGTGAGVGRRGISLAATVELVIAVAWVWFGAWTVWGQTAPVPDQEAKKPPAVVGQYSLVTTVVEPSPATHWLTPAPTIAVPAGTESVPGDAAGNLTVPPQFAIEDFGVPRYECAETAAKLRGCAALDRTDVVIRDANTVGYHIVTHGPAVQLTVNLLVHDRLPVSHEGPSTEWHAGEVIFVSLPKATASYPFTSETLMGTWKDDAIVFEVGKPLPAGAKKALDDLGVKQDLGDRVLYAFRVKEPEKK